MYSSQHLKWIKTFHQSCPKTKMRSCVRTTLINFFDPFQKRYRDKGDVIRLDRKSAVEIKLQFISYKWFCF